VRELRGELIGDLEAEQRADPVLPQAGAELIGMRHGGPDQLLGLSHEPALEGERAGEHRAIGEVARRREVGERLVLLALGDGAQPVDEPPLLRRSHQALEESEAQAVRWLHQRDRGSGCRTAAGPRTRRPLPIGLGVVQAGAGDPDRHPPPAGADGVVRAADAKGHRRPGLAQVDADAGEEPHPSREAKTHAYLSALPGLFWSPSRPVNFRVYKQVHF